MREENERDRERGAERGDRECARERARECERRARARLVECRFERVWKEANQTHTFAAERDSKWLPCK